MYLRLKVVRGKPRGHCLSFPAGEYMFGRGPECDVRPNSDLVSRQHCLLHVAEDSVAIRDLGSMNGTLVNGQLLTAARPLAHGDTLQIGPLVLEVLLDAQPETIAGLAADTLQTLLEKADPLAVSDHNTPTAALQKADATA
jgi:pSer/pThr/pTyr-binding forkhead associated (FHA) protein